MPPRLELPTTNEPLAGEGSTGEVSASSLVRVELATLVDDPEVRELVIRGPRWIEVDRGRGRERVTTVHGDSTSLSFALRELLDVARGWDADHPWLDARTADGARLRALDASVAVHGPVVVLTRPPASVPASLAGLRGLPEPLADYLRALLRAGGNLLVAVEPGGDAAPLLSACAAELAGSESGQPRGALGLVRAGHHFVGPPGVLVVDAAPGLGAGPIRLLVDAGLSRLVLGGLLGADVASVWAGWSAGLSQVVLSVRAGSAEAARATMCEGLALGGFGRDQALLHRHVAARLDALLVLAADPGGGVSAVELAELDESGEVAPILTRGAPGEPWRRLGEPRFAATVAARGLSFDSDRFAALTRA